jgi:hypothetical protein
MSTRFTRVFFPVALMFFTYLVSSAFVFQSNLVNLSDDNLQNKIHESFVGELFKRFEYTNNAQTDTDLSSRQVTHMPDTVVVFSNQQNPRRHLYLYNEAGRRLSRVTQTLQSNIWTNVSKEANTYDDNGNRLTSITQQWQNGVWMNTNKRSNTFGANNILTNTLLEVWTDNSWTNYQEFTYTHDLQDNIISVLKKVWA